MNVLDAIDNRKSIRAFRPDPVPKDTVEKILQIALIGLNAIGSHASLDFQMIEKAGEQALIARLNLRFDSLEFLW